jgi:hypothetical protein
MISSIQKMENKDFFFVFICIFFKKVLKTIKVQSRGKKNEFLK